MERSRSGEDVSSSNESDPERHMSDNSSSTEPETESNLKNVMVLLRRDVHENHGKVYMPKAKEMTQLKRPEKEQYKTGIKLTWNMTDKNVDEELRRRFPILGNNGRLSCATAADKGTRLEFHNSQGKVWDGSKINRLVRGNRVLYVLFEETSESVFERPDCSPQLQTPTDEPMEILHNDPSKQTAATADPPAISHESDSGLSSTRNNDVGVAIASNSADQSEDTSTLPEIFSSSEDGESALEEIPFEYQILIPDNTSGVVKEIFPSSGPILENIPFCITLTLKLPRNYRKLQFKANFEGIGAVPLDIQTGNATLTGNITSHVAGKVKVTVEYEGSNGNSIGFTFFEFIKKNDQVILGELSEVKLGQSMIFNVLKNVFGSIESSGSGIQEATPCGAGGTGVSNVTKRSYALPEKILTLLVYKAAEINGREFLEMVFNTSAGRVVFNYYRKSSTLPGDVARANGHIILGDFLEDVNERLSKEVCSEDSCETVNWIELKHAVEKKVCLPRTDAAQLVNSPDGDDNQSDYEADDEASLLPSPADANANGGELDDSEHGDIGQITLDKNDSRDSIATEAESQRHQTGTERQAEGGSLFTNRDDSEMEMESLSHGTDNVEIKSNPRVSYTDYSEKSVVNSAQDAVTNVALHPNQEGADPADDHFVSSAVMSVAGETSNAIELSSEGGANSSAERQNQEPTDSMTISLPCEINTGRSHKAKNTTS